MQMGFDLGTGDDVALMRDQITGQFGSCLPVLRLEPMAQLVNSLISSRTRDAVSSAAFERLICAYPQWPDLAAATVDDVQRTIADVTFPDVKARHLGETLRRIAVCHPDFDLSFLSSLSVTDALRWLEQLPGVGRKVSTSTLNFSTLCLPAFVIDTHILRVLRRFGFVSPNAETRIAYETMMTAMADWRATDLLELHVLLKRLGQTICRSNQAFCRRCPVSRNCKAAKSADNAAEIASVAAETGLGKTASADKRSAAAKALFPSSSNIARQSPRQSISFGNRTIFTRRLFQPGHERAGIAARHGNLIHRSSL